MINEIRYLGVFNFDGGEVNLPCPHASVVCIARERQKTFYLFDDKLAFERDAVADLSGWLAGMWPGATGYALPLDRIEMPEAFAGGHRTARPPRSTEDTTAWIVDRRDVPASQLTRLRDLFEVNILHAGALARTFVGQTLEEWIGQKPERGAIVRLDKNVVLWTIELEHLAGAREGPEPPGSPIRAILFRAIRS